jgi:hypothetical protein
MEDNIKMGVKEIMDWIYLAQDREKWRAFVNMVIKLGAP